MTAIISACGHYRYTLERQLTLLPQGDHPRAILWVMLNPSTADARQDDPTIRQCVAFSTRWGFDSLLVGNLYAYRTPSPAALWAAHEAGCDVVGPDNDEHLNQLLVRAQRVVIAWGAQVERALSRAVHVKDMLHHRKELYTLGWTKMGHPRHPLYQSLGLELLRC